MNRTSNITLQLPLGEFVKACIRLGIPMERAYRAFKAGGGYCLPDTFRIVYLNALKQMSR